MASPARKVAQSWHEDDPDVINMPIFVSQQIGNIPLHPNGTGDAVAAAFKMIGESGPGDNSSGHSEYTFTMPGIGKFNVFVDVEVEGHVNNS